MYVDVQAHSRLLSASLFWTKFNLKTKHNLAAQSQYVPTAPPSALPDKRKAHLISLPVSLSLFGFPTPVVSVSGVELKY